MNPRIRLDYAETGRWLWNFALAHAKREHPRLEARIEMDEPREGQSYGLRLVLDAALQPPSGEPPLVLGYPEVAEGRARFAWCESLAQRLRAEARRLLARATGGGTRSA